MQSYSMLKSRLLFFLVALPSLISAHPIALSRFDRKSSSVYKTVLDVQIPKGDALYADYLSLSVDSPDITLSEWHTTQEPIQKYDPVFKTTKPIYTKPFQINVDAKLTHPDIHYANLHVGYYQQSAQKDQHVMIPLPFSAQETDTQEGEINSPIAPATPSASQKSEPVSFSSYLSSVLETTDSTWLRLLLSLLLGIFLSLTPCIYPMIPITMGILQSQGSSSMLRNFGLALTYTMGIATTFALLGVTAAFTGQMFGNIMNNPIVILTIVAMLVYLAGSMLGLYEMYIPRFMQSSSSSSAGGSFASAFMFGAISGTVASPCLSPGLLLLLTIVTSIGSVALGFALLFFFGLGLGMPLLIIGTFSGSINMLPKAGMWMIDIKQFFGFIMLGTCFYFLSTLIPANIIAWSASLFLLIVGIFYLKATLTSSGTSQKVKSLLGITLVAFSVYSFFNAYKMSELEKHAHHHNVTHTWVQDYQIGLGQAQTEHKLLLLDVSAPYCTICKAIDRKHFSKPKVLQALSKYVTVKIEDIEKNAHTKALQKQFRIMGAPTILIIDPETEKVVKRWGSDLYDLSNDDFINRLP